MSEDNEKCPFCGITTDTPCDAPPPTMCSIQNEQMLRDVTVHGTAVAVNNRRVDPAALYPEAPRAWFTIDELNAWADKKLKDNPQWAERPHEFGCPLCYDDPANIKQPAQHPDDVAVDRFADAMKAKMAKQRAKGYGGWDDPAACPTERLQQMLVDHIAKGDPVDVANFAMMLWSRGERTEQPLAGSGAENDAKTSVTRMDTGFSGGGQKPAQQQGPLVAAAWQQGYDQGVADERTSEANIGIAGFDAKVNPARNNPYSAEQPAQQQEPVDGATLAGLHASISILSALVDEQRQLLVEVEDVCGRDVYGARFEDGESSLIDKVRAHLAAIAPSSQPAQQQEPVAWRFTGIAGLKRYMSQTQYDAQTPETKKWYEPFKCANCITSPPASKPWVGLVEAINWVKKRRDDFINAHGSTDPDTDTLEFGSGRHAEAKVEYLGELEEIIEGLSDLEAKLREKNT